MELYMEQPIIRYKAPADRTPDTQYRDALKRILTEGIDVMPIHGEAAKMVVGIQLRYPMANGFPVITERDITGPFKGALGEHIGFLNGAQTIDELEKYGCPRMFWERWVTKEKCAIFDLPEGDLGTASYGAVWARFPSRDGKPFNQVEHLVRQMKEMPFLRTHRISNWYPPEVIGVKGTRRVVVAPCHGDIHVLAFPHTKELIVHHYQRSGDFPVGVAFNIIQYAAFGMMLAQVLGYTFRELVHTVSDAHLYESQIPFVEELISREPTAFPTVTLDPSITNIFDFRREHFTLADYHPHPKMKIPTPT